MSIFNFVKEAGEKIWDSVSGENSAEQTEKLNSHIKSLDIQGTDDINIQVSGDDSVSITGNALTQEAKEKVLVAVGNVAGIGTVSDTIQTTSMTGESRYYTVKSGDTLSAISKAMYGTSNEYPRIFEANKPMLTHPDKIYVGQMLIIPNK